MATIDDKLIGSRLRTIRLQRGLTQAAVGGRLNFSEPYLSRIENGKQRINLEKLYDFCVVLGVGEMEILEGCCPELATIEQSTVLDQSKACLLELINRASPASVKMMLRVCQSICEDNESP